MSCLCATVQKPPLPPLAPALLAEVHRKHFNDVVVRVVIHDFYCCRLLDLSLLHLLCTGGCLAKRVLCVVERGVRWYIDLSGQPRNVTCTRDHCVHIQHRGIGIPTRLYDTGKQPPC